MCALLRASWGKPPPPTLPLLFYILPHPFLKPCVYLNRHVFEPATFQIFYPDMNHLSYYDDGCRPPPTPQNHGGVIAAQCDILCTLCKRMSVCLHFSEHHGGSHPRQPSRFFCFFFFLPHPLNPCSLFESARLPNIMGGLPPPPTPRHFSDFRPRFESPVVLRRRLRFPQATRHCSVFWQKCNCTPPAPSPPPRNIFSVVQWLSFSFSFGGCPTKMVFPKKGSFFPGALNN